MTSQIFFTSQLVGFLSFIPGGIIVTESSLLGLLLNQGVEFAQASIMVIMIRFWSIWIITIVGVVFLKTVLGKNSDGNQSIENKK